MTMLLTNEKPLEENLRVREQLAHDIAGLEVRLANEENDITLGVVEASAAAGSLRIKILEKKDLLHRLNNIIGSRQSELTAAANEQAAKDVRENRRQLAQIGRHQIELATIAHELAMRLGDVLRQMQANGVRLAAAKGDREAQRLFGMLGSLAYRVKYAFFRLFDAIPDGSFRDGQQPYRFIQFDVNNMASEAFKDTLPEAEQKAVDQVVNVFDTIDSARAARDRLDPGGQSLHVVSVEDLFELRRGQLRGQARDAPPADRGGSAVH